MSEHSPGPWMVGRALHRNSWTIWDAAGRSVVRPTCEGHHPAHLEIRDDDAHLIAVAPDLLAACKEAVAEADLGVNASERLPSYKTMVDAIAKVEGNPNPEE